jgi:hypothetical protein
VWDVFAIVLNLISNDKETKHVTIKLFEALNTSGAILVLKLQMKVTTSLKTYNL